MVTLVHPIAPYVGVDYFNILLPNPNSGFYRLFSYSHTGALLEHGVEYTMVGPSPTGSASALCAPQAVTLGNAFGKPLFATGVVGLWANFA